MAQMKNPIVHFEILAPAGQKQALQDFYKKTFQWEINDVPMGGDYSYGSVGSPDMEVGIGGAVDESQDDQPSVVIYLSVDDPNAYLEKVKQNGGEVVMELTTMPGVVSFAQFRDPAGNIMGLVADQIPPAE